MADASKQPAQRANADRTERAQAVHETSESEDSIWRARYDPPQWEAGEPSDAPAGAGQQLWFGGLQMQAPPLAAAPFQTAAQPPTPPPPRPRPIIDTTAIPGPIDAMSPELGPRPRASSGAHPADAQQHRHDDGNDIGNLAAQLRTLRGESVRVAVIRKRPLSDKGHVGTLEVDPADFDPYELQDEIRDRWGPGTYQLRPYNPRGGWAPGATTVDISSGGHVRAARPTTEQTIAAPAQNPAISYPPDGFMSAVTELFRSTLQGKVGNDEFARIESKLAELQSSYRGQRGEADFSSFVKMAKQLRELNGLFGGADDSDDTDESPMSMGGMPMPKKPEDLLMYMAMGSMFKPDQQGQNPAMMNPMMGGMNPAMMNPMMGGMNPAMMNPMMGGMNPAMMNPMMMGRMGQPPMPPAPPPPAAPHAGPPSVQEEEDDEPLTAEELLEQLRLLAERGDPRDLQVLYAGVSNLAPAGFGSKFGGGGFGGVQ